MARKMDAHVDAIDEFRRISADVSKLESDARQLRKRRDELEAFLLGKMQKSDEATVNGEVVFKIAESSRKSVTIGRVMEFAPKLANKIIVENTSRKIKVVSDV